ncbi:unnamed protein product, partial [Polarella glacialis]
MAFTGFPSDEWHWADDEDEDGEEDLADVESLLAQFRREDAEGFSSRAERFLAETEAAELAVQEASARHRLRALRSEASEARSCGALRERRRRLLMELRELRSEELREQLATVRERLEEQLRLTATLHAELLAASEKPAEVELWGASERPEAVAASAALAAAATSEEPECLAASEEQQHQQQLLAVPYCDLLVGKPADLLAEIRAQLLEASGSAASKMLGRALKRLGAEQYGRLSHFFEELLQNADDCCFPEAGHFGPGSDNCPTLQLHVLESSVPAGTNSKLQSLTLWHNEEGLTERDVRAICDVGSSTKDPAAQLGPRQRTGCKGVGFKSVFLVTSRPVLFSRGGRFSFAFEGAGGDLGCVLPVDVPPAQARLEAAPPWLEPGLLDRGTMLHLPLLPDLPHSVLHS